MNNKNIPIGSKVMIEMVFEGYNRDGGKSASFSFGEETPSFGKSHVNLPTDLIKSFEPPAFDWKDVKPGMAFKDNDYSDLIVHAIGWHPTERGAYVMTSRSGDGSNTYYFVKTHNRLTPAPEHDIEVTP